MSFPAFLKDKTELIVEMPYLMNVIMIIARIIVKLVRPPNRVET